MFFVGLSHPKCGTTFTSSLLRSNNLDVGHERIHLNGIISWMLVAQRQTNPWGDALGIFHPHHLKFAIARSPLSAMISIMAENRSTRSFAWRCQVIWDLFQIDLLSPLVAPQKPLNMAIMSYVLWYEAILNTNPLIIYRVDHEEDDKLLAELTKTVIVRNNNIKRNSRPGQHYDLSFNPSMLKQVPRYLCLRLAAIAENLGYPEDAKTILRMAPVYKPIVEQWGMKG